MDESPILGYKPLEYKVDHFRPRDQGGFSNVTVISEEIVFEEPGGGRRIFTVKRTVRKEAAASFSRTIVEEALAPEETPDDNQRRLDQSKQLLQNEACILRHLRERGNRYVPRIGAAGDDYFEMSYLDGVPGSKVDKKKSSITRFFIIESILQGMASVFRDGVVGLDCDLKNVLVHLAESGMPTGISLFDFGHALFVDREGMMTVPYFLVQNFNWGALPPEIGLPVVERYRMVTVNAEKVVVWAMAMVIYDLLSRKEIMDMGLATDERTFQRIFARPDTEFYPDDGLFARMLSRDSAERPSIEEVLQKLAVYRSSARPGKCISGATLHDWQTWCNLRRSEFVVDVSALEGLLANKNNSSNSNS
jgi:hypothetical protein